MWIMNIVDLIKNKNTKLEIVKVKSYSEDSGMTKQILLQKKSNV